MTDRVKETATDQRDLARVQKELQAELRRVDGAAPSRCLGAPSGVYSNDRRAAYGELLLMDPTNVALKVWLPKGERGMIGEKITVKNYSASTNAIAVYTTGCDTIDKQLSMSITVAWAQATFLLVSATEWICTGSAGCTDCKGTCRATCADSCLLGCGGTCTAACGGACTAGCGGSCSSACGGSCSSACGGTCTATCGGTCTYGCGGTCTAACGAGCTYGCGVSCTAGCGGNCDAACGGDCTATCGGDCTATCGGNCESGCYTSCKGGCEGTCVSGCWAYCTQQTG